MGEGFGASVAACDLNGDGVDDLIVGSPMYRCTSHQWQEFGPFASFALLSYLLPSAVICGTRIIPMTANQKGWGKKLTMSLLHSDPSDNKVHNIGRVHTFLSSSDENQWGTVDGNTAMLDTPDGLESGARFGSAVSNIPSTTCAVTAGPILQSWKVQPHRIEENISQTAFFTYHHPLEVSERDIAWCVVHKNVIDQTCVLHNLDVWGELPWRHRWRWERGICSGRSFCQSNQGIKQCKWQW